MARWSKLQSELYKIISDDIDFQIHCVAYRMDSQGGSTDIPRYWITIVKEIIWDYPKDFLQDKDRVSEDWPYLTDISSISDLIREYIDSPKEGLLQKKFKNDKWGLTEILKVADRRIGKRQLTELQKMIQNNNPKISNIIELRLIKQNLETALTKKRPKRRKIC